jgi:hypothetical protein
MNRSLAYKIVIVVLAVGLVPFSAGMLYTITFDSTGAWAGAGLGAVIGFALLRSQILTTARLKAAWATYANTRNLRFINAGTPGTSPSIHGTYQGASLAIDVASYMVNNVNSLVTVVTLRDPGTGRSASVRRRKLLRSAEELDALVEQCRQELTAQ